MEKECIREPAGKTEDPYYQRDSGKPLLFLEGGVFYEKGLEKGLAAFLSAAMLVSAAACGSSAPAAKQTGSGAGDSSDALKGELRVTTQAWMMGKYDFDGLKADFEKKHPGVTVTYNKVDTADVTTNMLQWAQGKTNCDIAIGGSREHAVQYAAKDYIISFDDDFFTGDLAKDKFFPAFLELGNVEGTQYMIPITGEVMFIVANKDLMKKAGLVGPDGKITPAKDWNELYEYAKKATVKEGGKVVQTGLSIDWGTNFMAYSYLSALQGVKGNFFESDGKTIDFTSPESKGLLTSWAKLVKDGYTPTDTFADMDAGRTNFKAGKVAMLMTAASRWIECQENVGKGNTTVMPIPGTDQNGSLVYIHGAVIEGFPEDRACEAVHQRGASEIGIPCSGAEQIRKDVPAARALSEPGKRRLADRCGCDKIRRDDAALQGFLQTGHRHAGGAAEMHQGQPERRGDPDEPQQADRHFGPDDRAEKINRKDLNGQGAGA